MQSFKSCVDKRSDDHAPHVFEFKRIFLMCRYNQSKVIDAKIASFDRQAHRQSSHTFQSHKESLKLMQMRAVPSVMNLHVCVIVASSVFHFANRRHTSSRMVPGRAEAGLQLFYLGDPLGLNKHLRQSLQTVFSTLCSHKLHLTTSPL